jgi:hypothetical protein
MNKNLLSLAVAGSMLLALASVASASGIPDHTTSTASSAGGIVMITPGSTGGSLASAGATITVTVLDAASLPIPGFPFQDIYLDAAVGIEVSLCQGGSTADANTDASGMTTISGVIGGGGHTLSDAGFTQVYINGAPLSGPGLPVALNSPDINGSLGVDLVDLGLFGDDFGTGGWRSDFSPSGFVDLTDFSKFGLAYGESCP